jgi:hypothetical protein
MTPGLGRVGRSRGRMGRETTGWGGRMGDDEEDLLIAGIFIDNGILGVPVIRPSQVSSRQRRQKNRQRGDTNDVGDVGSDSHVVLVTGAAPTASL